MQSFIGKRLLRSIVFGIISGTVLGLTFMGGYVFRDRQLSDPSAGHPAEITSYELLSEADNLLQQYFLGERPSQETSVNAALHGLVGAYGDRYTFYVEPQQHQVDSANLAGEFGGVGAEVGRDELGRFVLTTVYRDGPGFAAGLRDGDVLLAVDGTTVDSDITDSTPLLAQIRGPVGEPVVLTVLRGDQTLDIEVVRAEIIIPSVLWRLLEENNRIGYIRLTRFTGNAPQQFEDALDELIEQGATAFVVDLRGNGGGLVGSSIDVADHFLASGLIIREERSDGQPRTFEATRRGKALDQPLVLLVDGSTASASEIVAGALQDYGRAKLIGSQTFGKGSVQTILEMSNQSSLHITSARWYTPNDTPLDGLGLTPDVVVEPVEGIDAELQTAIDILEEELIVADTTG